MGTKTSSESIHKKTFTCDLCKKKHTIKASSSDELEGKETFNHLPIQDEYKLQVTYDIMLIIYFSGEKCFCRECFKKLLKKAADAKWRESEFRAMNGDKYPCYETYPKKEGKIKTDKRKVKSRAELMDLES